MSDETAAKGVLRAAGTQHGLPCAVDADAGHNEDTLLADDDYNDTLQLLSQPTGNQPLSRKQSTAGLMQRAAGLSALDLTLPEHLMNLSSEQLESQGLTSGAASSERTPLTKPPTQADLCWQRRIPPRRKSGDRQHSDSPAAAAC